MLKTNQIGLIVIALAVLLGVILYSFSTESIASSTQQCEAELTAEECPHQGYVPPQAFLGTLFLLTLGGLGAFLSLQKEPTKISLKPKIYLKSLDNDEKAVYKKVLDSNGVMLQSEVIDKTGFSKVKVKRILDKLDAKNVL